MKILVTGASGFIGQALCNHLKLLGFGVIPLLRRPVKLKDASVLKFDSDEELSSILEECDYVIHLAGRAHVLDEKEVDPIFAFREINVQGTVNLARLSARSGIRRFIFISSIKVNGENTPLGSYFMADDVPSPKDPYGISKWEAEEELRNISYETGLETVIIRPPLVYGQGVKGNFRNMMKWLEIGVPLPFGSINNRRSLVGLDNLCDAIYRCIHHPAAAGQTFIVSDDEDLSTTELLKRTAVAMNVQPRLVNVPQKLLEFSANVFGRTDLAQRLLGSLQLDISKTKDMLDWKPPISLDEGLRRVVS